MPCRYRSVQVVAFVTTSKARLAWWANASATSAYRDRVAGRVAYHTSRTGLPRRTLNPHHRVTRVCPARSRAPSVGSSIEMVAEANPAGRASRSSQLSPNHPAPRRSGVRRGFAISARYRVTTAPRRRQSAPGLRRRLCATGRRHLVQPTSAGRQRLSCRVGPDRPVRRSLASVRGAGRPPRAEAVLSWSGPGAGRTPGLAAADQGAGFRRRQERGHSASPIRRYGP